jgi:hypothetical protein
MAVHGYMDPAMPCHNMPCHTQLGVDGVGVGAVCAPRAWRHGNVLLDFKGKEVLVERPRLGRMTCVGRQGRGRIDVGRGLGGRGLLEQRQQLGALLLLQPLLLQAQWCSVPYRTARATAEWLALALIR